MTSRRSKPGAPGNDNMLAPGVAGRSIAGAGGADVAGSSLRLDELIRYARIERQVEAGADVADFSQALIDVLGHELGYQHGAVLVIKRDSGRLEPLALDDRGRGPDFVERDKAYVASRQVRVGFGVTGWVARTGLSFRTGCVRRHDQYLHLRSDIQSELCVPIRERGVVVGVLNVETTSADAYTPADDQLLQTVADRIGYAMDLAHRRA